MLSAAANAAIFFMTLILGVIVGLYLLAYAAHCFLTVLQNTAAGLDEVTWPDEPLLDWLRQALQILGLAAVWLVPPGILCRALRHGFLPDDGLLRFLVVLGPVFWLTFPVGVLSSLSGTVQWVPLRWTILRQMLRLLPETVGFYVSTAFLGALAIVPWYFAFARGQWVLVPVASILTGAAVLIYPRLLGRLAWRIGRSMPPPPQPKLPAAASGKKPATRRRRKGRVRPTAVEDPWKVPDDSELPPPPPAAPRNPNLPPSAYEIEAYAISSDDDPPEPRPLPKRRLPDEDDEVGVYDLDPEPPVKPRFFGPPEGAEPPPLSEEPEASVEPPAAAAEEAEKDPPPRHGPPLGQKLPEGVWNFPVYARSVPAWVRLSLGWFVLGVMVLQLLSQFRTLPE